MLEALELASKKMSPPQDTMLIDLNDNGAIKFMTKKQNKKTLIVKGQIKEKGFTETQPVEFY